MNKVELIEHNQDGTVDIVDDKGTRYENCYMTNVDTISDEEDGIVTEHCRMVIL